MKEYLSVERPMSESLRDDWETGSAIEIMPATHSDLEQIVGLMERIYPETYPNDKGITRAMFEYGSGFVPYIRNYLAEQLSDSTKTLLLAKDRDSIVGTIGIQETEELHTYEIWGFYVDPGRQKEGIGTHLWDTLMRVECLSSAEKLMLYVAQSSREAKHFYEQRGFKVVGTETWDWPHWTKERPHNTYWKMVQ